MVQAAESTVNVLLGQWSSLSKTERLEAFHSLPHDKADDFFLELNYREQYELVRTLPKGEHRIWLRLLAPDDAADLLQLAPQQDRSALLDQLDDLTKREVTALLAYKEDAAGGLMSPRFARLRPEMTIDEAISYLRRQAPQLETIYYAYALDEAQHLLGVVSFRDLFSADRNRLVREAMRTEFVAATEDMDQEAVAKLVAAHHLLAVPVLDREGRMQGIVTVDDIVDVVQEEDSEDIQKLGGMEALDGPYLEIGFWQMVQKPWVTLKMKLRRPSFSLYLSHLLLAAAEIQGHKPRLW
jgi:magnesium transporter